MLGLGDAAELGHELRLDLVQRERGEGLRAPRELPLDRVGDRAERGQDVLDRECPGDAHQSDE